MEEHQDQTEQRELTRGEKIIAATLGIIFLIIVGVVSFFSDEILDYAWEQVRSGNLLAILGGIVILIIGGIIWLIMQPNVNLGGNKEE